MDYGVTLMMDLFLTNTDFQFTRNYGRSSSDEDKLVYI